MSTPCPQCYQQGLIIQQAPDSNYKEVFCPACLWRSWLKNYNKKPATNAGNN